MNLFEIVMFGIALAMDCFSVSIAKGLSARRFVPVGAVGMAVAFGVFQAGMPLIGYLGGTFFAEFIGRIAPWLALVLLGFIGGKMIYEHFHEEEESDHSDVDYRLKTILLLSVATSIDALATGLLFVSQPEVLWLAIGVIGVCSFLFSLLGTLLGVFVGQRFRFPAELVGGLILIGIGLKIFIEGVF